MRGPHLVWCEQGDERTSREMLVVAIVQPGTQVLPWHLDSWRGARTPIIPTIACLAVMPGRHIALCMAPSQA